MDRLVCEPLNSRHDKYSQQHHPSYRQHRQDRKACRRPTRKARHPHPARIAFHRDPVRLGEPADLAAGTGRCRQGLPHLLPRPGRPRFGRRDPRAHRGGQGRRRRQAGAALRPRRGGGRAGRGRRRASGLKWTILRASFFSQNFSEGAWLEEVLSGTVSLPIGDVVEPFIDTDDIADVAVAALTDDRHIGQTYEMTGPRLLSFGDAVGEIAKATGRDVTFASADERVRCDPQGSRVAG